MLIYNINNFNAELLLILILNFSFVFSFFCGCHQRYLRFSNGCNLVTLFLISAEIKGEKQKKEQKTNSENKLSVNLS